uniref:Uncharacterized protein n=1 Tax=Rhizophora mucronata TaxID=61149 RepID=A0A2P2NRH6_RHIMU
MIYHLIATEAISLLALCAVKYKDLFSRTLKVKIY